MAVTTIKRRPGRPRELPVPVKLGIRFKPELYERMDRYLASVIGERDTQRSLVERALQRELDRLQPEGAPHEHRNRRTRAGTR